MIEARRRLSLRLNPLLHRRALWLPTRGRAFLRLWAGRLAYTGQGQQVWKNAGLPCFRTTLGSSGLRRPDRFVLKASWPAPERSSGLNRTKCGDGQPTENRMGFGQGCLLSRAAILNSRPRVSEEEVSRQRLGSRPINKGGSRRSNVGRSAAGLDLNRERPRWTSHACVGTLMGG